MEKITYVMGIAEIKKKTWLHVLWCPAGREFFFLIATWLLNSSKW